VTASSISVLFGRSGTLSVGNIEDIDFPSFTPSDLTDKQICALERRRIGVEYIVDLFYRYPVSVFVIEFLLVGLVRWNVDLVFRSTSGSLQICRAADGYICLL
jgi:hypothetical protein